MIDRTMTCHRFERDDREEYWLKTVQAMTADPQTTLKAYAAYLEKHNDPERAALYRRKAEGQK